MDTLGPKRAHREIKNIYSECALITYSFESRLSFVRIEYTIALIRKSDDFRKAYVFSPERHRFSIFSQKHALAYNNIDLDKCVNCVTRDSCIISPADPRWLLLALRLYLRKNMYITSGTAKNTDTFRILMHQTSPGPRREMDDSAGKFKCEKVPAEWRGDESGRKGSRRGT